ncbi:MAG: NAD-dependent epimerase/dehydratase family protein [Ignavibacteriales bacterium]|nr:NAD-dependent epimerase/dehydratase family protein [Ignavibacteriales bacterium]
MYGGRIANALVTGGTGFIGSHTVELLLKHGLNVQCLIRPGRKNIGWLEELPVEVLETNLLDSHSLEPIVRNADYIFHIAGVTKAKQKKDFFEGNATTTQNLLEAAKNSTRLKKFCLVGSLTAVGPSENGLPFDEEAPCNPITTYGKSKLEAEKICRSYSHSIPIVIIRPPAVYGPRDQDILEIFRWVVKGFMPIIGGRQKTLSFVYATDLARAIMEATLSEKTRGETYFVADQPTYLFTDLVKQLATIAGKKTIPLPIPSFALYPAAAVAQFLSLFSSKPSVLNIEKARDLLQHHWVCSSKKIEQHIGFRCTTSIDDGLRNTYHWYKGQGWL